MRRLGSLPLIAVACALLPLRAVDASVSTDVVTLNASQGAPGSHFSGTFDFGGVTCNAYRVSLWWMVSDTKGDFLGDQDPVSSGQDCVATVSAVVPPADAVPGRTYTVLAEAHPQQVNTGNGSVGAFSSNDPSATAPFGVTSPPQTGDGTQSKPSSQTSAAQHPGAPASQSSAGAPTAPASTPTDSASAASVSTSGSDSSDSSATTEPAPQVDTPLAVTPRLRTPARGGLLEAMLAGLAASVAMVLALTWAHRTGTLSAVLRRWR